VTHGIPDAKTLKEGDIVNIDVTPKKNGYHGDSSRTFAVGKISLPAQKLIDVCRECLSRAIKCIKPGARLGDIGYAIESYATQNGFSVVRDYCGHGIGREFHGEPQVLHYGRPGTGLFLKEGMVFTIEPMINQGTLEVKVLSDGWTAVTRDGLLSAQFEHTIAITKNGVRVLTE